jgi:predicted permease
MVPVNCLKQESRDLTEPILPIYLNTLLAVILKQYGFLNDKKLSGAGFL